MIALVHTLEPHENSATLTPETTCLTALATSASSYRCRGWKLASNRMPLFSISKSCRLTVKLVFAIKNCGIFSLDSCNLLRFAWVRHVHNYSLLC